MSSTGLRGAFEFLIFGNPWSPRFESRTVQSCHRASWRWLSLTQVNSKTASTKSQFLVCYHFREFPLSAKMLSFFSRTYHDQLGYILLLCPALKRINLGCLLILWSSHWWSDGMIVLEQLDKRYFWFIATGLSNSQIATQVPLHDRAVVLDKALEG